MTDPFAFMDAPLAKSGLVEDSQNIRFTEWKRADRAKRQTIEAIGTIETIDALNQFMSDESLLIDALFLFDGDMSDDIQKTFEDQAAILGGYVAFGIAKVAAKATSNTPSNTKGKSMANPDFKKFVFKDVTFSWPRLDQPYRYNPATEKSEPCPVNAQGAGYSLAWQMPNEKAKEIHAEMKAHYDDCRTRNSKLPEFNTVFGLKKLKDETGAETGMAQFTAKKSAMSNDGNENKMPVVVDAAHSALADRAIWGGSTGHVRVLAFPSTNPQDKSGGVSLLLDAVVVTQAEYGGDSLDDDFGAPAQIDDLPTAASTEAATSAPAPEGAAF